jgi:hypothetical protein
MSTDVESSDRPPPGATSIRVRLGIMLASAGGFLDAYTYVEWSV